MIYINLLIFRYKIPDLLTGQHLQQFFQLQSLGSQQNSHLIKADHSQLNKLTHRGGGGGGRTRTLGCTHLRNRYMSARDKRGRIMEI